MSSLEIETRNSRIKHVEAANDSLLAQHYELTDEELDFIINYDIKYRMGDALFEIENGITS